MLTDYFYVQLRQSIQVAVPVDNVTEVISVARQEICPIPGVFPALLGVVNQRGRLLWVLELSDLFNLENSLQRIQSQDYVTLLLITAKINSSECHIGCIVSMLRGIVSLDSAQFQPVSNTVLATMRPYISNLAQIEQSSVAILNINSVLTTLQTFSIYA